MYQHTILVTGGLGFIGHNVVEKLRSDGHTVIVVDNQTDYSIIPADELTYIMKERRKRIGKGVTFYKNCINDKRMHTIFKKHSPSIVIHLASFPRQKVVNANPQKGSNVMVEGMLNMLELSKEYGVTKFVYASSSMVYGDFEDQVTEDAECTPRGQYAIMKLTGEMLLKDYHRKYNLDYAIIRPSAVYGPYDVEDRVVSKFLLTAMRGETLQVNGESERLDFTYVDDIAAGFASIATSQECHGTYNVTRSHARSLLEIAELSVATVGGGDIKVNDRDVEFPQRGELCIARAKKDFWFTPKVDTAEGIVLYYDWLQSSKYWQARLAKGE